MKYVILRFEILLLKFIKLSKFNLTRTNQIPLFSSQKKRINLNFYFSYA